MSFYFANATGDRRRLLNKMVRAGGGTRHDILQSDVTHVVFSGKDLPAEAKNSLERLRVRFALCIRTRLSCPSLHISRSLI